MNLLIDMGNSRLKWSLAEYGRLATTASHALVNQQLNEQNLRAAWQHLLPPQRIAIACVSANSSLALVQAVIKELWADVEIINVSSQAQAFGVTNAYVQAEKLGVDRWLVLIAARKHYALPVCVVDCGTAITIDILNAKGVHQGGLISAGLHLMKKSLASNTDALSFVEQAHDFALANDTDAAIYNGTLAAAAGLINTVYAQHQPCLLLLTGGDAGIIAPHLNCHAMIDRDLVLRGLALAVDAK